MPVGSVLLGEYDSETTAFTALAGGGGASPYSPTVNGTITELRVVIGMGAATCLINHVEFRLKCSTFQGLDTEVGATGQGLATAPAFMTAGQKYDVSLPIQAGVPITIEARNITADTPVGVQVFLYATIKY